MRIMLVASDKGELKGFDDSFIKIVSGVGLIQSASSTAIALCEYKPDVVFSIGSAGVIASDNTLKVGEAYSFSYVVTPDQNLTAFHIALGSTLDSNRTTFGAIKTEDSTSSLILGSSGTFYKEHHSWHDTLNVSAVDMEAYGVGVSSMKKGIPFYAVKLITDTVGDNSSIGKVQFNLREGRSKLIACVSSIVEAIEGHF